MESRNQVFRHAQQFTSNSIRAVRTKTATRNYLTTFAFVLGFMLLFAVAAPSAQAGTTYTYTGNAYTNCSGTYCTGGPYSLSITFTTTLTGSALANLAVMPLTNSFTNTITSFTFTDGSGLTIENNNAYSAEFHVTTDANGNIIGWFINACLNACSTQMQTNWNSSGVSFSPGRDFSETAVSFSGSYGYIDGSPGTWMMQTIVQPFSLTGTTTANFTTSTGQNELTFDTSTANGNLTCNFLEGSGPCGTVQLSTANTLVQDGPGWPQYVVGTPWAPSMCAARPANGGSGNLCSLFTNACYGGSTGVPLSQASDYYCPSVPSGFPTSYITIEDVFDALPSKPSVAPGTTVSLLDFTPSTPTETWAPWLEPTANPVCTNPFGPAFQCDIFDSLVEVYGDQTTTRGKAPPTKGWIITAFGVPMLQTIWQIIPGGSCPTTGLPVTLNSPPLNTSNPSTTMWFNGGCQLGFAVHPASALSPNNGFTAAPPATMAYGLGPAVYPLSNDQLVTRASSALTSPATTWTQTLDTLSNVIASLGGSSDGSYTFHWSASDLVKISEKNVQLLSGPETTTPCLNPNGDPNIPTYPGVGQSCYTTNLFTMLLNVDSTFPTISGPTLSTNTPLPNQVVTATYSCADPTSNNVASGIATCGTHTSLGGEPSTGPLNSTFTAAGHGPQSYQLAQGAIDVAGNSTPAPAVPYFVGYQFFGFFAPVSNPGPGAPANPVVNMIKAGQTVPLKWQVLDGNGVGVTGLTLNNVKFSATYSTVCQHDPIDNPISVNSSGGSGLQDLGGGNYQFNWKTSLPPGACVLLTLDPGDGTLQQAYFYAK